MYEGNKLFCRFCKYHSKLTYREGELCVPPCRNIDHNTIKFKPQIFNGYDGAYDNCHICSHYAPKSYIRNSNFTNIEEYIEWLDTIEYETPQKYKDKRLSTIRHFLYVTLQVKDVILRVPLYNWLNGTWLEDNKIIYKLMYKIEKNKMVILDEPKLGEFNYYQL